MKKAAVLFAEGYEEVEALCVVDVLRRANVDARMLSIEGKCEVTSSHGVTIKMDGMFNNIEDLTDVDALVLPGGMPGTVHLRENSNVLEAVKKLYEDGKIVAAICAAPTVLGKAGVLNDKKATCHPGHEDGLTGAKVVYEPVVKDGTIITSRGAGTALAFGLALLEDLIDEETAKKIKNGLVL